jgi:hypothetical protein
MLVGTKSLTQNLKDYFIVSRDETLEDDTKRYAPPTLARHVVFYVQDVSKVCWLGEFGQRSADSVR